MQDPAEPGLSHARLTHPEMIQVEAQLLGFRFSAGKKIRVRRGFFPTPAGGPVGHVREGRRIGARCKFTSIRHQRAEERIRGVAHFRGEFLQSRPRSFWQPRVVAEGHRHSRDMHASFGGNDCKGHAAFVHRGWNDHCAVPTSRSSL